MKWTDFQKQKPQEGQRIICRLHFPPMFLVDCVYSNDGNADRNGIEFDTDTARAEWWVGDNNIEAWLPYPEEN